MYLDNGEKKNSVHFFTAYSFLLCDNQTESSIDVCIEIIERGESSVHFVKIYSLILSL